MLFQKSDAIRDFHKRGFAKLVFPVFIMKLLRTVYRDSYQPVVFTKKLTPLVGQQGSVDPQVEFSGCYEKCASATALVKRAMEVDPELKNGRAVFAAFSRPEVRQVVDGWIGEIVYGLITLVHVFNPARIVLGGGVMAQPYVLEQVRERLAAGISPGFRGVEIVTAKLGNQAGLMGAAYQAVSKLKG